MTKKALRVSGLVGTVVVCLCLAVPAANADIVGSIFLTGHDSDIHAALGNAVGAQHVNQAAINFIMDPAFNTFVAGRTKEFLFVECDTCAVPGGHTDGVAGMRPIAPAVTPQERLSRPMARRTVWRRNWVNWEQVQRHRGGIGFQRHADASGIGHLGCPPDGHYQLLERGRRSLRHLRGEAAAAL